MVRLNGNPFAADTPPPFAHSDGTVAGPRDIARQPQHGQPLIGGWDGMPRPPWPFR